MKEEFLPSTLDGKLDRLIEECAEVIQVACKVHRFGLYNDWNGITNQKSLYDEIEDLQDAIARVKSHIERTD